MSTLSLLSINTNEQNSEAVHELYESYAKKLLAYTKKSYSINEDDAISLVYKTIYKIAAVQNNYQFDNEHKKTGFIFKTHVNYLRNYFRDNKTFESKNHEVELKDDHAVAFEETTRIETPQLKVLQKELDKLEEWQRILLLMRGQNMSYKEIIPFVNKPEKQLKVYYARLKKQLLENVNAELKKLNAVDHGK